MPERYARLRNAALQGDRSVEGLSIIAFHGLWHGLSVLARQADACTPTSPAPAPQASAPHADTHDRQLVRLLATMVLATQSRECHVY